MALVWSKLRLCLLDQADSVLKIQSSIKSESGVNWPQHCQNMSLLWFNKLENPLIYSRLIQDLFKRVLDMSAHVYTCSRQNLNISVENSGDSKSDK